jgi:hypothetical protein
MKKIYLLVTISFVLSLVSSSQNIFPSSGAAGIGTTSPHPSSLLDIKSTNKGLLIPRMTKAQRNAISSPATGLMIYQTDIDPTVYWYNGTQWISLWGAARNLSNLINTTAVNRSLLPGVTNSISLGSSSKKWKNLFLSGRLTVDSIKMDGGAIDIQNGTIIANTLFGNAIEATGSPAAIVANGETFGIRAIGNFGIFGQSNDDATGVWGDGSFSGIGVRGESFAGTGVQGSSTEGLGGNFFSDSYWGLKAATNSGDYAGAFYGNIYSSGLFVPSDQNLKKDIKDISSAMAIISALKPKYYKYKTEEMYASINLPKGDHYGLLSQEVEEVLPQLVMESVHKIEKTSKLSIQPSASKEDLLTIAAKQKELNTTAAEKISFKAINYSELIPIVIKALQEQQVEMNELRAKNEELLDIVNQLKSAINQHQPGETPLTIKGYLKQNNPNPLKNHTVINYDVPGNINNARICVTDVNGRILKTYAVGKGQGQLILSRGELSAGTYNYTLYLDDKISDTKQMVVTK